MQCSIEYRREWRRTWSLDLVEGFVVFFGFGSWRRLVFVEEGLIGAWTWNSLQEG